MGGLRGATAKLLLTDMCCLLNIHQEHLVFGKGPGVFTQGPKYHYQIAFLLFSPSTMLHHTAPTCVRIFQTRQNRVPGPEEHLAFPPDDVAPLVPRHHLHVNVNAGVAAENSLAPPEVQPPLSAAPLPTARTRSSEAEAPRHSRSPRRCLGARSQWSTPLNHPLSRPPHHRRFQLPSLSPAPSRGRRGAAVVNKGVLIIHVKLPLSS